MEHELTRFPPILQLVGLALLGVYVLLSIAGRLSSRLAWLWDNPSDVRKLPHVVEYTLLPALLLCVAFAAFIQRWDPGAPLGGGWTARQLVMGPLAALCGLLLVALVTTINRRRGLGASDPSQPWAWVPLVALLLGMGLMASGIFSMGRTLKRAPTGANSQAGAPR